MALRVPGVLGGVAPAVATRGGVPCRARGWYVLVVYMYSTVYCILVLDMGVGRGASGVQGRVTAGYGGGCAHTEWRYIILYKVELLYMY